MTRSWVFIIATLFCAFALLVPARAAPCGILAGASSTDLRPCSVEADATDGLRQLHIDLAWAGPGVAQRVLDLRVPDVVLLEVRQRDWDRRRQDWGPAVPLQSLRAGSAFEERVLPSPRIAVPLLLSPGSHRLELDYRVHLGGRLYPLLDDDAGWRARQALNNMFAGLQWGLMLAALLLVLTMQVLAREAANAAYAGLLISHGLGLMQIRGDTFAYLWPHAPLFNQWVTVFQVSMVMCAHAWFAARFMRLRERSPRLYRVHLLVIGALVVNTLASPVELAANIAAVLGVVYAVMALGVSLGRLRNSAPDARLYAAGTGAYVLFMILLFAVAAAGHNPWPRFDYFVFPEIGYLLETSFLSAALLWRVRQLRSRQAAARQQQLLDAQALIRLESARREANARSERNTLLFAGASHDLSQPLASLRMALGALRLPQGQEPIASHLDHTIAYAQTLLRDILAQARREHRAQDDRFALGDCIAHVVREHGPAAAGKGLRLVAVETQVEVCTSSLLVARVLHNLVSNAVRYTHRGRIVVGVRRRAAGVELQVIDTGPGLLPEQLGQLQRPFQQGASAALGGHGLGLFIVRTICDQNGYRLRIASHVGRGSTFGVLIPVEPC